MPSEHVLLVQGANRTLLVLEEMYREWGGVGWNASRAARQRQSPRVLVQNGNTQQKRQTRMRVGVRTVWLGCGARLWSQGQE